MARKRFYDKRSIGKSKLVPFKPEETPEQRHARRLQVAIDWRRGIEQWCAESGLSLRITNNDLHWQFTADGFIAEWWPSTAKLVIGKRYNDGIHCHDWLQLKAVIGASLKRHSEIREKSILAAVDAVFASVE